MISFHCGTAVENFTVRTEAVQFFPLYQLQKPLIYIDQDIFLDSKGVDRNC